MNLYLPIFLIFNFNTCPIFANTELKYVIDLSVPVSHEKIFEKLRNSLDVVPLEIKPRKGVRRIITAAATEKGINGLKKSKMFYKILHDSLIGPYRKREPDDLEPALINNELTFKNDAKYEDIQKFLKTLHEKSTERRKISVEIIGKSYQDRDINLVKIEHPKAKNIVFIHAGIHAREWLTITTALYLITKLIGSDEKSSINDMSWYIVPLVNPDGYHRTWTMFRLLLKNLNFTSCPSDCRWCGVDLDRNFEYQWGVNQQIGYFCGYTYPGAAPFSEKESQALANILKQNNKNIKLYLALHSYGCKLLYPCGYEEEECDDAKDLIEAAEKAVDAMGILDIPDLKCKWGVENSAKSSGSGNADDYAKKFLNIKYSYKMMLQGGLRSMGYIYTGDTILPFVKQSFKGIVTLANYVNKKQLKLTKQERKPKAGSCITKITFQLLCIVIFLLIY